MENMGFYRLKIIIIDVDNIFIVIYDGIFQVYKSSLPYSDIVLSIITDKK